MAVKLRLRRMGRKKRPIYRIVAADAHAPRDGRFIEEIGHYNPLTEPATIEVNQDRAIYWLTQGAIPTTTVKSLFRRTGINLRFDLMKRGVAEEKAAEEIRKWEALQEERRKRQEVKKAVEQKQPEKAPKAGPVAEKQPVAEAPKAEKVADLPPADTEETAENSQA